MMRRSSFVMMTFAAALLACPLYGQSAAPGLSSGIQQSYNRIKNNFMAAAEAMPEEDYGFQPVKEERTFGGWVAHIADAQMGSCSQIAGARKTINAASMTSKADLVAALKQSFDACDAVYSALTDANAGDPAPSFRGSQPRLVALANTVAHDNEAYGSMAVYMRLKGIVPPSSEHKK